MEKINNNKFVMDNYKLIISACKVYYTRCSGYIDFDDYLNHCCLILLYRKSYLKTKLTNYPFFNNCIKSFQVGQVRFSNQLIKQTMYDIFRMLGVR